ncbi:MAG: fibronectin type III domain-containing protein [Melioribacteraceae bacterium]|nr:MAG: fibronectin type III domain-containing protein [Melioribacteraceae bacterium]
MLQFLKKATLFLFSLLTALIFLSCERNSPTEIIDDGIPPTAPIGLSVFRQYDGEVGIEWISNLEKDIKFYKIFRSISNENNFAVIDSTSSTYFLDVGLEYDSTYYYKIKAVDLFGYESDFSAYVSAVPQNLYPPYPPYYLSINARNWNDSLSMKITFGNSFSTDVKHYEIHRSLNPNFSPDNSSLIGVTNELSFIDKNHLDLLVDYYYKIISVDKGNLQSQPSVEVRDFLLDKPIQISPENNASVDYFAEFKIQTCSKPADYRIVVQANEIYGPLTEINFSSNEINKIITVPIKNITFAAYADYYWRVFTYTKGNNIPNSFSKLQKFTIIPGG